MKYGFTIVEMIIVLMIISISAGAGYVTYNTNLQNNLLDKESEVFANVLTTAKERAVRRDMTPNPTCADFRGYDVVITTSTVPHTYQIRFLCRVGAVDVPTPLTEVYSLNKLNFHSSVPNGTAVTFYKPYGCIDTNCSNIGATKNIIIQSPNISKGCITITVNNAGIIAVGEPAVCS